MSCGGGRARALQQCAGPPGDNFTLGAKQPPPDAERSRARALGDLQAWRVACAVPSPLAGHAATPSLGLEGGIRAAGSEEIAGRSPIAVTDNKKHSPRGRRG
ncbi:hypothetical protein XAC3810_130048 [Xanthomonas citri pv. citri]|uniref:Uncharacterized protein n=1 Tax=Xanthomonas citri pv. citri TaxID=611301 RepID=A0A0U5F7S8_XANCI|nr:hypothetical protein XAC3824_130047 [Xanthomonas citri pv. citri]CEE17513.1 hypothetical protein XAC9322_130045 [Xanthomonas citri pv. citri]CEE18558.1 hypothetical protein XAC1083_140047 [Xanthomonas citri pv. citri]CEE24760.1 hypothetical protein XAC902_150008 [Xanthomonas citri pv. citri]CEE25177.1 hypothetical protein XAC3810_130048 [Xanthomonas citri pv. citri]